MSDQEWIEFLERVGCPTCSRVAKERLEGTCPEGSESPTGYGDAKRAVAGGDDERSRDSAAVTPGEASGIAKLLAKKMRERAQHYQERKEDPFDSDGVMTMEDYWQARSVCWSEAAALVESWFATKPDSDVKRSERSGRRNADGLGRRPQDSDSK